VKLSLRARLVGAIVGAVVLIFICSLVAARIVLQHDLYDLGRTEVTAEESAFGGYVAAKQQQVQLLVTQESSSDALRAAMQSHDASQVSSQLSDTAGSSGLSFLTAVDLHGHVLGRAHAPAAGSLASDPLVQRALNGETVSTLTRLAQPFLQSEQLALQAGTQRGGLAIVATTPISDAQERTIGALYGGVLLNHSYDLVDEATRATGGATAILDGDTIISSSIQAPDGTRLVDVRVPAADAVMQSNAPFMGDDTEGGVVYLARIAPIADDQGHVLGSAWYGIPLAQIGNIVTHTTQALVLWGISGDHVAATKQAVEQSGRIIAELATEQPSPKVGELQRLNGELQGDVTVIETLAQEMSSRMQDAVNRVAELNAVAADLNELVTGESSST
jgi:hypothetical protein